MAKLVVLSAGMTGRSHLLKAEKTTIGRVEDNMFQIPEPSVSSHHCEVVVRGNDVLIRDLNSTNGTFINGEKVSESVLKLGQVLRLGQIELRLDTDDAPAPAAASSPAPSTSTAPATTTPSGKKPLDHTMVMQRGVNLTEFEQGRQPGTPGKGFSKKDDKVSKIFWIAAGCVGVIIVLLLVYVFTIVSKR
jgi:pSer/pThr/pTyr-binding forkhead associated (FHA) protein